MGRPEIGGESRRLGVGSDTIFSYLLLVPVIEETVK